MTQAEATHEATDDAREPDGLASSWPDAPPARRALAVEADPYYPATPVRFDEAFPEYEAYHSVIEAPSFDAVAVTPEVTSHEGWGAEPVVALDPEPRPAGYGWSPAAPVDQAPVAPGLTAYPTVPEPVSAYTPAPAQYSIAPAPYPAAPAPYPSAQVPYPAVPGPYVSAPTASPYPSAAAPMSAYDAAPYAPMAYSTPTPQVPHEASSGLDAAAVAIGGSAMLLKYDLFALPAVVAIVVFTVAGLSFGGSFGRVFAAAAWIIGIPAILKSARLAKNMNWQTWSKLSNRRR